MDATIVEELRKLNRPEIRDPEHDCTAAELTGAVCNLMAEIVLKDDTEGDKFYEWEGKIRELRCDIIGEHTWTYDHCGYWGHIYCLGCEKHKYPELGMLSCSEAIAKIGDITEDEYEGTKP